MSISGKVYTVGVTIICIAMFRLIPKEKRKFATYMIIGLLTLTTVIRVYDGTY
jgi:hypothetical protein